MNKVNISFFFLSFLLFSYFIILLEILDGDSQNGGNIGLLNFKNAVLGWRVPEMGRRSPTRATHGYVPGA